MLDLPAESATWVAHHRDRKAALTVDKADDPLLETWSFLLIDRTGWIVTARATLLSNKCDTNEYHRILGVSSI